MENNDVAMEERRRRNREYMREYSKRNPDYKKKQKAYRQTPEFKRRRRAQEKIYRGTSEFKFRQSIQQKIYYSRPEVILHNREYMRNYRRKWRKEKYKTDFRFRIKSNLYGRLNSVLRQKNKQKTKRCKDYGIDFDAIIKYLGPPPNDGRKYDIDHLVPLSYFDFQYPEHIRAAFLPENHQWLEASENARKGNHVIQLYEKY